MSTFDICSGSYETLKYFIINGDKRLSTFRTCLKYIGMTGYTYMLDIITPYLNKSFDINAQVLDGFDTILLSADDVKIFRIATILLRDKFINAWSPSIIKAPLEALKLFRKHLGIYNDGTLRQNHIEQANNREEILRYLYMDESGPKISIAVGYIESLIRDTDLSDDFVELILIRVAQHIRTHIGYFNKQILTVSRIELLKKYGILVQI